MHIYMNICISINVLWVNGDLAQAGGHGDGSSGSSRCESADLPYTYEYIYTYINIYT